MNEFIERQVSFTWRKPKRSYDVIIVGGGGHGLATAYYLATRHGITNVAVLERNYIGSGNSGRNTTIIRANYGIPEAVRFYQRSVDLYASLERETGRSIMHRQKGLLWLAHSEAGVRAERARAEVNEAFGTKTEFVEPGRVKQMCPQIDITGRGSGPSWEPPIIPKGPPPATIGWFGRLPRARSAGRGYSTGHAGAVATGFRRQSNRCRNGPRTHLRGAGALGGRRARHQSGVHRRGLRLPIRTHPLQAFVTNHYALEFPLIVFSSILLFYASQTARGEMLMGAEIDRQPSYSYSSTHHFLQSCAFRAMTILPFLRNLRILRQWAGVCDMSPDYSPVMGQTGVDGLCVTTGWGTWGFKAIPAGGEQMAELIATGKTPPLIAPFSLDRFARDRTMADRGSAGTH